MYIVPTFSKGFVWFYWKYYRDYGKRSLRNEYDYDGYTEKELCVERKYDSYKQETLSHINMKSYRLA